MKKALSPSARLLGGWFFLLTVLLAACQTPIGVRRTGFEPVYKTFRSSVLDEGKPGHISLTVLEYFGLRELYVDDPDTAIRELEDIADRENIRGLHVPIAELHYGVALAQKDRARFLASAIHAYIYLFDDFPRPANPYSNSFRLACELYNRGLARAMLRETGEVGLTGGHVETPTGPITIEALRPGFPWSEEFFSEFLPADTFEVRGLRERVRDQGLGVPLIAVQATEAGSFAAEVGREIKLPATSFLRLEGGREELRAGTLTAKLELYLGTDVATISVGDEKVPLEADITAPLAYTLESSTIWSFGIRGFLSGKTEDKETGIFALQPYQPGKIPLVLIHGTASSPATWAQTINGIMADTRLRSRYQVWLGMYNTGNPIAYSAALQRRALTDLVERLDPEGADPALQEMILVGHSQGGLVVRLLVTSSGKDTWNELHDTPFDELDLEGEFRDLLERAIFFEPLPFVRRAVFISTPHRGSFLADSWMGRFASRLVNFPGKLRDLATNVFEAQKLPPELRKLPTSVDNMDPDSRFVTYIEALPFGDVEMNSIVAVKPTYSSIKDGNDGVVEYKSARLEESGSEFVVRHSHSCQGEPATISELRRILFLHLAEFPLEPIQ